MSELEYNKLEITSSQKKKTRGRIAKISIYKEREKKPTKEVSIIDSNDIKIKYMG